MTDTTRRRFSSLPAGAAARGIALDPRAADHLAGGRTIARREPPPLPTRDEMRARLRGLIATMRADKAIFDRLEIRDEWPEARRKKHMRIARELRRRLDEAQALAADLAVNE